MNYRMSKFTEASPDEVIRLLQEELAETNREILALTLELEKRVEERTEELEAAQKELERKNERLESANKELEAFSYSVSHDLRAPLRHLVGFVQALEEDCHGQLGAEGQRYVKRITEAAEQMGALIGDLLSFARTAQQPMALAEVDFSALVDEVRGEMQSEQAGRQIEWVIQALPVVRGDPAMLRQVWSNLLSNAIKYTRNKAPARIEVSWEKKRDGQFVFCVRDNGAGFSMQYADKLFGLFQRLHNSQQFEGTGLGLAIVRRIIDRHGGRTWAEGEVNQGAAFYFSLPGQRSGG